ncbi:MAG: hypothetical protein KGJ88_11670 [Verrucomicrobiota bacterium]|nr:hypothetical protein [Verrucomicrobiota bacterium]
MEIAAPNRPLPPRALTGLFLLALCWPLDWSLPRSCTPTAFLFFPLWLGYILLMDALVWLRSGTSFWTRSRRDFILLFILSAPVWWLFELINLRAANWEYLGANVFTPLEYNALCALAFSTVMPAVFETAEWVCSFRRVRSLPPGARVPDSRAVAIALFAAGFVMLVLLLLQPRLFYPFTWISLFALLEPVNRALGRPHLLHWLDRGDWRPVLCLSLGALICGFFWEMWNYWSWPKWVYHVPGADFLRVFEMPILGYGGYIPFGLELFALKNFLCPRAGKGNLAEDEATSP